MSNKLFYKNKCVSFVMINKQCTAFGFQDIIVKRFRKIDTQEIVNLLKDKNKCENLLILNIFIFKVGGDMYSYYNSI